MARSRNHSCHGNATMHSLRIVISLYVTVNNIKSMCVATETKEYVSFALLSSYETFRTANTVNDANVIKSSRKVAYIAVRF